VDTHALLGYPPLLDQVSGLSPLIVLVIQAQGHTVGLGIPRFDDIELHDLSHLQPVAPGVFPAQMSPFIAGVPPGVQGAVLDALSIIQCPLWQQSQEDIP
ncbi:MAG: chemotaxis protein CheW, partial [Leptolyngbya sp. SIO1D8]|nr:chemotaxis protein CheW [Leptolyngbya sp. SIO1D8]